jgi:hypothetical protein
MLVHFQQVLEAMTADPDRRVGTLDLTPRSLPT